VFILPFVLILLRQSDFFYVRYLTVFLPFLYLAIAAGLNTLLYRGVLAQFGVFATLALYIIGSTLHYRQLAEFGKGDYATAVDYLYESANGKPFTVGSDFDFRNKALLDFYSRYREDTARLAYVKLEELNERAPEYFLDHSTSQTFQPAASMRLDSGVSYDLVKHYPFAGLSGWHWALYKRDPGYVPTAAAAETPLEGMPAEATIASEQPVPVADSPR
ncbi:MAG: hypothetical protein ACR2P6_00805, partial [Gammaproteobacteria bacterium]